MSKPPATFLLASQFGARDRSSLSFQTQMQTPTQPPKIDETTTSMPAHNESTAGSTTAGSSLFAGPTAPASTPRPAWAAGIMTTNTPQRPHSPHSPRGRLGGSLSSPLRTDHNISPGDSFMAGADQTLIMPGVATAQAQAQAQAHKPKAKEQNSTLMFRNPLPIATVIVHGARFAVHTDLLCRDSAYFVGCLRGSFAEAETQTVVLDDDDMTADDFGLWVDLLYRVHFNKPGCFVLRKEETGGTLSTMQLLTLWKLSDRFLNKPLAAIIEESLQHRLSLYSVEQWRKLYRTRPAQDIRSRVSRLQDAYRYCCEQSLPFADAIVAACANSPAQVYDSAVALLDKEFMEQVSRRMIMAHADISLLSKEERAARLAMGEDGA